MNVPWVELPGETPIDLSGLTNKARALGIETRNDLSALEAQNIRGVVVKYLSAKPSDSLAPFDFAWVLKVHGEMFNDVWQWAGQTRTGDVNIGAPVYNIQGDLFGLLRDLPTWTGYAMPLIEQAARLHHRAVAIHPFPNGNGRWSRMIGNIWLKRHGAPVIDWPEETFGQHSIIREKYIAAVKAADTGDYKALIELHEQYAQKAA